LPQITIAGGFATEDQVFKGLALGAPHIDFIGIGRAAMAAAQVGRQVGDLIKKGTIPKEYRRFGSALEEIFADIRELKEFYGSKTMDISTGAIGLYSSINRISLGPQQFMALNRKFALRYIDRSDIIPLTELATKVTRLDTYRDIVNSELNNL